ncbi:hypothetical protein VOLCADRAFT_92484 [Volvox carteri f. nagariensis]|uniref:Uncharacterized protein n=1 Tax=Volvox carteri f. nagariensis TaxID=3068 RepID=D8TZS5_VOLCA|nr:uncharacterized protein VOLCADRAFT_92484 [Volvox carteri f. nagariensis]EFJ46975.1 hypothetical protein VOLCADRAFT_92484 [Volvox carteri f. nagariensis]|eukprot:XP_002951870.1 hypothetical protein VOLCADRAFT_92484 [Volvox carteri f. nagariensis]
MSTSCQTAVRLIAALVMIVFSRGQSGVCAVSLSRKLKAASELLTPARNSFQQAEVYLDGLFADYEAAKARLGATNFKKSNVLVVYMFYERAEVIRSTLTSLLMSQGLENFDLMMSQDGLGVAGTPYVLDVEIQESFNALYIHHEFNLCTGLHHYFVKKFGFDVMGYDYLLVVEEDNLLHYQALKLLKDALDLSLEDKEIGLVSITDMDNSLLVDDARYNAAVLRADVDAGHLWIFGIHRSRYNAVSQLLTDYFNTIKGHDYKNAHVPPLRDSIRALHAKEGFPKDMPLSQDSFLVHSLFKQGYTKRFVSMVRLALPMGWLGLHIKQDKDHFYTTYGQGMFEGVIVEEPFAIAKNPYQLASLKADAAKRLDVIYRQYLGRGVEPAVSESVVLRLVLGRMNAVELVRDIVNSAEHRRRMKEAVAKRQVLPRSKG